MNDNYNPLLKEFACELRNNSISKSEKFIWKAALSRNQLGVKFKRQRPIDRFIVDFFCAQLGLIVEIDGSSHFNTAEYNYYRQNRLENLGYTFLRFNEGEVMTQFDSVHEKLIRAVDSLRLEKDGTID